MEPRGFHELSKLFSHNSRTVCVSLAFSWYSYSIKIALSGHLIRLIISYSVRIKPFTAISYAIVLY
jgi:hypothetical protein